MGPGLLSQNEVFTLFSSVSNIALSRRRPLVLGILADVIEHRAPKVQLLGGRHPIPVPCSGAKFLVGHGQGEKFCTGSAFQAKKCLICS
jgi:hypothetical protein